jgi:hypothetical protein
MQVSSIGFAMGGSYGHIGRSLTCWEGAITREIPQGDLDVETTPKRERIGFTEMPGSHRNDESTTQIYRIVSILTTFFPGLLVSRGRKGPDLKGSAEIFRERSVSLCVRMRGGGR